VTGWQVALVVVTGAAVATGLAMSKQLRGPRPSSGSAVTFHFDQQLG